VEREKGEDREVEQGKGGEGRERGKNSTKGHKSQFEIASFEWTKQKVGGYTENIERRQRISRGRRSVRIGKEKSFWSKS